MKLPLSLIKSYLPLEMSPVKIGETLTMLGIEVDHIYNEHPPFAGVVVGEILAVKRHPDAKTLQIAEVSDGSQRHELVCGASNCRAGMKTAFAKVGAILTDADGMQRRIEKTSIRGIESNGMLCSSSELHLSADHDGILDLPHEMQTGADLISILWDPILELSLTPNLGHCMSALGIARELSAALQIPLHLPKQNGNESPLNRKIHVRDFDLCSRYMCRLIEGVKVGPSPFWLKRQLEACGQKSINSVVDIANYIMMKTGQPLHAFDYDLLEGDTLEVGPCAKPQMFLGLDGVEREVPAGTILISDSHKPVAIAGIMGGANSAVSEKTTRILIEAASFNPLSIRNTAKKIGLRTESAQRFEKGIDLEGIETALNEACQLIGASIKGGADIKKGAFPKRRISYRPERINHLLGTKLSTTEMEEIFDRLGLTCQNSVASIPSYRHDITEEIDLVEEIARIYGYNNIEKGAARCTTSQIPNDPIFVFENKIRNRLVGLGLFEFLTCDLISPKLAEIAREFTSPALHPLKTIYSKSEEYSVLRTSLLPGLLHVIKGNFAQKNHSLAAFEIGRIHFLQKEEVIEIPMAAILLTGNANLPHWSRKTEPFDFFDLKGMIENLLHSNFARSQHVAFHPGRQADIHMGDLVIGSLGQLHPTLLEKFDISEPVYYAELNLSNLLRFKKSQTRISPLPQFPSSERDWTVPLDPQMQIDSIFDAVHSLHSSLLERIELIDLYHPESAPFKNATFRFIYRDKFKTISFEEVEAEHAKMIGHCTKLLAK